MEEMLFIHALPNSCHILLLAFGSVCFFQSLKRLNADFIAIHAQEVGGKNYEDSMQHVNKFVK